MARSSHGHHPASCGSCARERHDGICRSDTGLWQTCANRLYRWQRKGTWDRILAHVPAKSDAVSEVVWEVNTTARAPQHASGARRLAAKE